MKARVFLVHTGNVESWSTGTLVMWHREGFDSISEGLQSLGNFFRVLVEVEHARDLEYRADTQCPHCHKPLLVPPLMGVEDVKRRVDEVLAGDLDGSRLLHETSEATGWQVGAAPEMLPWLGGAVLIKEDGGTLLGRFAYPKDDQVIHWVDHVEGGSLAG